MSEAAEDLASKHRRERKELQAQIQSLKKSCTKGDKKKKKEVAEEIAELEQNLDSKHKKELDDAKQEQQQQETQETAEETSEKTDEPTNNEPRVTKAQKRRLKKENEDREREIRIQVQEEVNKNGPRMKETEKINGELKKLGLQIHPIPADGNCLYCAVGHQLEITGRKCLDVPELRGITADYLRKNKDDFLPFMTHPDIDDLFTDEQYEDYCTTLSKKPVWGGQIEIRALSSALECPIKVIQADSSPTVQGEQYTEPPLTITYHRHLYRLGEHYNSTIPYKNDMNKIAMHGDSNEES